MITLNLLKQKKAFVCATLLLSSLSMSAQDPVATGNTEITGVTVESFFAEQVTSEKNNVAANLVDGDITTDWAGEGDGDVILDLGGSYDLAEIQCITVAKDPTYRFQIWVSTTGVAEADFTNAFADQQDTGGYLYTSTAEEYKSFVLTSVVTGATYVKFKCLGRSDSAWNTISEVKFYEEGATASTRDNILSKTALYPNPANDLIYLSNVESKISKLEILNLEGRTLITKNVETSEKELTLNTSKLANGVYFVRMSNNESNISASKTIVVQH